MNDESLPLPNERSPLEPRPAFASSPPTLLFRLAAALTLVFVVTVFVLIATTFGDARSPMNQFLDRWIGWLLAGEFIAILFVGSLAILQDSPSKVPPIETDKSPVASD